MLNRLPKAEIKQLRTSFQQWQTATELAALEERIHARIGSDVHLNQAGLGFLHDAIIAAHFTNAFRPAAPVRLCKGPRPDFQIRLPDDTVYSMEATLADLPGRRMGDEYRGLPHPTPAVATPSCPYKDEAVCREHGPTALKTACEKKIRKGYSTETGLVIYFNFFVVFDDAQKKIAEEFFLDATEVAKDHFKDVFVLWGSNLCWLWQSGRALNTIRRAPVP